MLTFAELCDKIAHIQVQNAERAVLMENNLLDHGEIGRRLRRRRRELGLLQRELAVRAGVSESFIGQVERGCKHCSAESVARLSRALELSADELMFGD